MLASSFLARHLLRSAFSLATARSIMLRQADVMRSPLGRLPVEQVFRLQEPAVMHAPPFDNDPRFRSDISASDRGISSHFFQSSAVLLVSGITRAAIKAPSFEGAFGVALHAKQQVEDEHALLFVKPIQKHGVDPVVKVGKVVQFKPLLGHRHDNRATVGSVSTPVDEAAFGHAVDDPRCRWQACSDELRNCANR
jgi:hypothetical protein